MVNYTLHQPSKVTTSTTNGKYEKVNSMYEHARIEFWYPIIHLCPF